MTGSSTQFNNSGVRDDLILSYRGWLLKVTTIPAIHFWGSAC